jgi:serine/threonine protein kinase, bacterial
LVADTDNNCIRQISPSGMVTTIAGMAKRTGSTDGPALSSTFNFPVNICVDFRGDIFVADWKNNILRKITYAY